MAKEEDYVIITDLEATKNMLDGADIEYLVLNALGDDEVIIEANGIRWDFNADGSLFHVCPETEYVEHLN